MKKYKVRRYIDHIYEVWGTEDEHQYFMGSLADCEAWIRLEEDGYLN